MLEIDALQAILNYVKRQFVGKDAIIDLLGIALVARENAFLLGPPGTAKSALVRELSYCIEGGNNFEYLLTRFTEPNELFGPFDIRKLQEGELVTNTTGMLPEASLVFLDEIFNANSAILNSLLTALNERVFRRGKERRALPALLFVGASNQLPEEQSLAALLDRFLLRIPCNYVAPDQLGAVLQAGWKLAVKEQETRPRVTPELIINLQQQAKQVDLSNIQTPFIDLVHRLRNAGLALSDRRAVKLQGLFAASAVLAGRQEAEVSDFWVVKYIWDTEEQIEILAGIIDTLLKDHQTEQAHPQAYVNDLPNGEQLLQELHQLGKRLQAEDCSYEEKNLIKDQLRHLQNRSHWIQEEQQQKHLQTQIETLWKQLLATA